MYERTADPRNGGNTSAQISAEIHKAHADRIVGTSGPRTMDFAEAFVSLRHEGQRLARRGWNGAGMWIALQVPDAQSKMSLPYIFMHTAQGQRVPWVASQTDILANDWYLV